MATLPSSAPKLSGDALAAVQLLGHASDVLEQQWHPESSRSGPRVPYVVYDPRERIKEVLRERPEERERIEAIRATEGVSEKTREQRVRRLTRRCRREHLNVFVDRLLAQKMSLAAMQLQAREIMNTSMIAETGETLASLLDRAGSMREGTTVIWQDDDTGMRPKKDYVELFPPGSFRIAEHRVTIRQLHALIDGVAVETHLPPPVIAEYRSMYANMVRQSRNVHEFRQDHQNDRSLFRACFGFYPHGHVDIIQGPLGLHFRCHALEDYAKVYADERDGIAEATHCQMQRASLTGGLALGNRKRFPEAVRNGLTLEQNDTEKLFLGDRVGIYEHEQDHIYNRFFQATWMNAPSTFPPCRASSVPATRSSCRAYMRDALDVCRVLEITPSGKDEMLAQFGDGDEPQDIHKTLLRTGKDSLYDFIASHRRDIRATGATTSSPFTVGSLMREHVTEPYQKAVERAAEALESLEDMGLDRACISELLRVEPLEKWPRLARLLSERQ